MANVQASSVTGCAAVAPAPAVLGHRASLVVSAGVVAHTLWTSAAPAMAYRLYAQEWHLSHTVTTAIFAIYPLVVVAVLIGFGDLSDHIGRRATMLAGLAASLAGTVVFALAPNVLWLFAARALMGVGVGLSAGPATAAVVEFTGAGGSQRAALITTLAQAAGFAAGLLLGGALTEYAPWPTRLPFWLLAACLALLLGAAWRLPRHAGRRRGWSPRLPSVPRALRGRFVIAAIAMMTAYSHGVLVLSLGGQVARDLVGSANGFVNGAVLALFPILAAAIGLAARSLAGRRAVCLGALASTAGMGLLVLAVGHHDLPVFLLAVSAAGAGYALLFQGGLAVLADAVPTERRGGVLSALFLLAYLAMGTVALALGAMATARGLGFAIELGAAAITGLGFGAMACAAKIRG